jgi:hypothetical protein
MKASPNTDGQKSPFYYDECDKHIPLFEGIPKKIRTR